jgi:hypothetical protein
MNPSQKIIIFCLRSALHSSGTADADPDGVMSATTGASGPYADLIDLEACTAKTTGKGPIGAG